MYVKIIYYSIILSYWSRSWKIHNPPHINVVCLKSYVLKKEQL